MSIKLLKEEYPTAIFCANMKDNCWVEIDGVKYEDVEWDEYTCMYRVSISDEWYYLGV